MYPRGKKEQQQKQHDKQKYLYATAKKQPDNDSQKDHIRTNTKKDNQIPARPPRALNRSIQQARTAFKDQLEKSEYTQAQKTKNMLKYYTKKQNQYIRKKNEEQHQKEKYEIKLAHQEIFRNFRASWNKVFAKHEEEKRYLLQKLAEKRAADEKQCRQRIMKRCQSARPVAKIAKIYQLQQIQNLLRKRGKTVQLRRIRQQKKSLIIQCKRLHERSCSKIAQQQQKRMAEKQTRRYNSFIHKIESKKRDNQRNYKRQQHRLKQKYKNILKNLEHQQKISSFYLYEQKDDL